VKKDGIEAVVRQLLTCGSAPEGPGAVARLEILFCCHVDDRFGQHGQSGSVAFFPTALFQEEPRRQASPILQPTSGEFVERFHSQIIFPHQYLEK
jgi:hypothetical protein